MRKLAPRPSHKQFARIARAIDPGSEVISTRQLAGGTSARMDVLEFGHSAGTGAGTRSVVVRQ